MRKTFSQELIALAQSDSQVILLTGDHGYALFDEFRVKCSGQYLNAGIAEQNMVGMAAGLAKVGFKPIVYGLSAFVPIRVLEQIKLDVAHDCLPVIFIGDGAGVVYSYLGSSHQSTEDMAVLRALPNMTVFSPADGAELAGCFSKAYLIGTPVYIRMGKDDLGEVHQKKLGHSAVGNLIQVSEGSPDLPVVVATGSMVKMAQRISLEKRLAVWTAPCIKPLDSETVLRLSRIHGAVITMEEHSVIGGLGSAVLEGLSLCPVPVLRIGIRDKFSEKCGSHQYLLSEHGLDYRSICSSIEKFIHGLSRT